jgi:LAGLIDADG endonuclease
MHIRELHLLQQIRDFLNVGNLVITTNFVHYNVNNIQDLGVILNHIYNYPLLTFKSNMVLIFNIIRDLMINKAHLNKEGILLIIAYINLLNNPINPDRLILIENELGKLPIVYLPPVIIND